GFMKAVKNRESKRFGVRINHHVEIDVILAFPIEIIRNGLRVIRQINGRFDSAPANIFPPESASTDRRVSFAKTNHELEETENVRMLAKPIPVQPSCFV